MTNLEALDFIELVVRIVSDLLIVTLIWSFFRCGNKTTSRLGNLWMASMVIYSLVACMKSLVLNDLEKCAGYARVGEFFVFMGVGLYLLEKLNDYLNGNYEA